VDTLYKVCKVMGSPTKDDWQEGLDLADNLGIIFPQARGGGAFRRASPEPRLARAGASPEQRC
jgi:hypothetical protein